MAPIVYVAEFDHPYPEESFSSFIHNEEEDTTASGLNWSVMQLHVELWFK